MWCTSQQRSVTPIQSATPVVVLQNPQEPPSSSARQGPAASIQMPQASSGGVAPERDSATHLLQASGQRGSDSGVTPAIARGIAESLHAPKRRRRGQLDLAGKTPMLIKALHACWMPPFERQETRVPRHAAEACM